MVMVHQQSSIIKASKPPRNNGVALPSPTCRFSMVMCHFYFILSALFSFPSLGAGFSFGAPHLSRPLLNRPIIEPDSSNNLTHDATETIIKEPRHFAINFVTTPVTNNHAHAMTIPQTIANSASSYKLSDSTAFQMLPREPTITKSAKELRDLKELEDRRLDRCADKGMFWEQCFIFGESDSLDDGRNDDGESLWKESGGVKRTTIQTW
jgi:hypothetical protein